MTPFRGEGLYIISKHPAQKAPDMSSFVIEIFDEISWIFLSLSVLAGMSVAKLHHNFLLSQNHSCLARALLKGFAKQPVLHSHKRIGTVTG